MGECKGARDRSDGLQNTDGLSGWIGTVTTRKRRHWHTSCSLDDAKGAQTSMKHLIEQFPLDANSENFDELHKHHSIGNDHDFSPTRWGVIHVACSAYNALLGYCARHKDYEQCVEVMTLMDTSGFRKNILICNHILANLYVADRPFIEMEVPLLNTAFVTR